MAEVNQNDSDEVLMQAYAVGNALAFDLLYHRHKNAVYRFFIRQGIAVAIAEELAHDTWLKVINSRHSYQVTAKFTTYLFIIARRLVIDLKEKKSTQFESSVNDESFQPEQGAENYTVKDLDMHGVVKQQIALLPFEQREVFLLKQEAGFSIDDIANITSQHKEKVKSRWRYALKKLREGLSLYVN